MEEKPLLSLENELVSFWVEDDILMEYIKTSEIDLEIAQKIVDARLQISVEKERPILVDLGKLRNITKEARHYFAKEAPIEHVFAIAIIANNPVSVMGSKLYILLDKPRVRTETFLTKRNAIRWLKSLLAVNALPGGVVPPKKS